MNLFRIGDDVLYLIKSRASPSLASLGQRQISDVLNRQKYEKDATGSYRILPYRDVPAKYKLAMNVPLSIKLTLTIR